MKKTLILAAAVLLGVLWETGCAESGPQNSAQSEQSASIASVSEAGLPTLRGSKLSEVIRSELSEAGWTIRDVSPTNLGIFQEAVPQALFAAKNEQGQLAFLSWFETVEQAETCYAKLIPNDSTVKEENGSNYQQAVITMPDSGGLWVFRQVGGNLFGAWSSDPAQEENLISLMDSYQMAE